MAGDEMDLESQIFFIENISVANLLVDDVLRDLEHLSEEMVHVKLLDYCYSAHDEGVSVHAFQNLAATAVLLLAIERKKAKS